MSQPVYAVDLSVWPRCDAEASPERGFYYHPSRHSAGQPIVAGWAYQWLAQLSFTRDSWTAPLDVRRVHPSRERQRRRGRADHETCVSRLPRDGAPPLFVFDAGYDSAQLTQGLAETPRGRPGPPPRRPLLLRRPAASDTVAQGRSSRAGTAPSSPARIRRPGLRRPPSTCTEDEQYGTVRVRAWAGLHPEAAGPPRSRHPQDAADRARHRRPGRGQPLAGPAVPAAGALAVVGRTGQRRTWTCCGAPTSAASTWSTPCASASRASAGRRRGCATRSKPIAGPGWSWPPTPSCGWRGRGSPTAACPGSGRSDPGKLTPSRVRRALSALLPMVGTPASAPKPCGRSPGRPTGSRSGRATRYPALKKAA